ncbi:MAG: PilC/PilY family type IV pilus protein [Myxococcota bacterium]|nr:PilC/PilY family type IV pilus protein [Myxococcota bacterium]
MKQNKSAKHSARNPGVIQSWVAAPLIAALLIIAYAPLASAQNEDDLFLFTSSIAPNVLIQLDNSGSMKHIVWHPAFDPDASYDCSNYYSNYTYYVSSTVTLTRCGRERTLYHDPTSNSYTWYSGKYLNWIFSSQNTVQSEIDDSNNGVVLCEGTTPTTYAKYQINRLSSAKRVVLDTMCEVLATKNIRFGLSVFRETWDGDPNGGYIEVGVNDNTASHAEELEDAVISTKAETWTPLAETLFQSYTYFMSRDNSDLPPGNISETFPKYSYNTSPSYVGGYYTSQESEIPASPVQYTCQKNFVIVITDGEPTKDSFDPEDPKETAAGFSDFSDLIGDYNDDGENEEPSGTSWLYLDDVAKFMHENDCRPDMEGEQTLDIYTIGFTTGTEANELLQKTADVGNGLFFTSNNPDELRTRLVSSITDILEKTQSFTAATVPSTRTASGGSFYTSFFLPSAKTAFWEGHLRAFRIDAAGDVYGQGGVCAFIDDDAGECNSGPANPAVLPFWDAGEEVPLPSNRALFTSKLSSGTPGRVVFDSALGASDLTIETFTAPPDPSPNPIYPGSGALNAEGLADEVIAYAQGCSFGSGVSGSNVSSDIDCDPRSWRLGDIFHSAPAVIPAPRAALSDVSYQEFKATYSSRKRIIYAGANDGFLHAFDAGGLDLTASPPEYLDGTGAELFGFMPWEVRRNIKHLFIDDPTTRTYYVDGSPQVVDTWIRANETDTTKSAEEWHSILMGGLRQGGRSYYALDVTNPEDAGYPGYLWEFPNENDPDSLASPTSILPYLGQSWSQPIITRVKVKIDSDDNNGLGYERWVAIVTGGYDPTGDPNDHVNYDSGGIIGRAILMIDMATGELLAMKHYSPSASDAQASMSYAIPSTAGVLDLDFDGFADIVYVGDLGGQIFKWVISPLGDDRVNDSSSSGDYSQPSWPFKLFFQAPVTTVTGSFSYYKSFFTPPQAVYVGRRLYLSFGSGERMNIAFDGLAGEDENNRFYSVTDLDPYEQGVAPYGTLTENDLTEILGPSSCENITGRGFFLKTVDGEKFVTNAEIFQHYVFVGSFTPDTTADPCTSKGNGRLYAFRVDCGQAMFSDSLGEPTISIDIGEGMPTDPQISVGVNGKDNRIYVEKSGADLESIAAPPLNFNDGSLIYWREVTQ